MNTLTRPTHTINFGWDPDRTTLAGRPIINVWTVLVALSTNVLKRYYADLAYDLADLQRRCGDRDTLTFSWGVGMHGTAMSMNPNDHPVSLEVSYAMTVRVVEGETRMTIRPLSAAAVRVLEETIREERMP